MTGRYTNRHAVVTGAGSGIGRAIALRLASEGAKVSVLESDSGSGDETVRQIGAAGGADGTAACFACDVGDQSSVDEAMAQAVARHGAVDVLINNAGIAHVGNIEGTTPEDMERLFQVNVMGVYHCTRAVIGEMVERSSGVFLNMASIASNVGISDRFAYSMTKGAVLTMTLSVARDYVGKGIRCNCLCPARVHTPFVDGFLAKHYPGEEAAMFEKLSKAQPIGRMGTPEEIAGLAAFLCSDEAAFITGSAYDIDGGCTRLL